MLYKPFVSLLHSRKFLLTIVGVVIAAMSDGLGWPADIVIAVEALLITLVGSIAYEDANKA